MSDDGVKQARKASVNTAAVGLRLSQSGRETELNRNTTGQLGMGLMANEQGEGSLDRKLPRGPWRIPSGGGESPQTGLAGFLLQLYLGQGGVLIDVTVTWLLVQEKRRSLGDILASRLGSENRKSLVWEGAPATSGHFVGYELISSGVHSSL